MFLQWISVSKGLLEVVSVHDQENTMQHSPRNSHGNSSGTFLLEIHLQIHLGNSPGNQSLFSFQILFGIDPLGDIYLDGRTARLPGMLL